MYILGRVKTPFNFMNSQVGRRVIHFLKRVLMNILNMYNTNKEQFNLYLMILFTTCV